MDNSKKKKNFANKPIIIIGLTVIIFFVVSTIILANALSTQQSPQPTIDATALRELVWNEDNINKFLADKNRVSAFIDAMNSNIDLYLGLADGTSDVDWDVSYSENDPYIVGIREYVATLENGYITNADELMAALKVLQIDPPVMP